ncbi:T9SS type A sorting domain-containing protein [Owenweeksia hongkongensis]|uniref:T9SS type A sorting domain-containing protein n=1 Tax=Owenweeksia hongkongensis TaxID=253245 RepID=UPI003A956704
MKKALFLFITAISLSSSAQVVDPLSQFFNNSFFPNIVAHDSITLSADSGSQFSAIVTGYQHYFVNGKIDTLTITQGGMLEAQYKGVTTNGFLNTTISGYSLTMQDSIDKITFILDKQYRDSAIFYYAYQNGQFEQLFEARTTYTAKGEASIIDIYADLGTGPIKIGDYRYFYKQGLLDSLFYTVSLGGQDDGYFKYNYDPANSGRLLTMEGFQDVDNDGELDLVQRFICTSNQLNQIIEITELSADNNLNLILAGEFRFDKQTNSTISLKELTATKVSLYPNPTSDYLLVDYNPKELKEYQIIDMNGKPVQQGTLSEKLDLRLLPKGAFQILLDGKSSSSATFIKE